MYYKKYIIVYNMNFQIKTYFNFVKTNVWLFYHLRQLVEIYWDEEWSPDKIQHVKLFVNK